MLHLSKIYRLADREAVVFQARFTSGTSYKEYTLLAVRINGRLRTFTLWGRIDKTNRYKEVSLVCGIEKMESKIRKGYYEYSEQEMSAGQAIEVMANKLKSHSSPIVKELTFANNKVAVVETEEIPRSNDEFIIL